MGPITGQIETVERARSGKSWRVKINSQWFSCKEDSIQQMVGQVITFTPEYSEYRGKSYAWVNDWHNGTTGGVPPQQTSSATPPPNPVPPAGPAPIDRLAYLPMTSNLVAHAIAAGQITEPGQIGAWARAAYSAAQEVCSDEFHDDIPF